MKTIFDAGPVMVEGGANSKSAVVYYIKISAKKFFVWAEYTWLIKLILSVTEHYIF